ncbi:protein of unknown function [Rubritalea squalenifaciens DSM 18772]|uniref:DUF4177 domain-containing protein n=1 Tax=Rubritalea squalenifaciens DSM 18772 TaxID=1123071 RepID=A0A1M6QN05_9BACT|nr:DUF4177 domain-containing protein [Rubritalea squalenifaciens]SHK21453.1 protein of unknown function [Rubritalea squalenifaciens DSM 18772]
MKTPAFLILLWILSQFASSAQQSTQWEYKLWEAPNGYGNDRIERVLNQYGAQGWELTSAVWTQHPRGSTPAGKLVYHFKRPLYAHYPSRPGHTRPTPPAEHHHSLNIYLDKNGHPSLPRHFHGSFNDTVKAIIKRQPDIPITIYALPSNKPSHITSLHSRLKSYGANQIQVKVDR